MRARCSLLPRLLFVILAGISGVSMADPLTGDRIVQRADAILNPVGTHRSLNRLLILRDQDARREYKMRTLRRGNARMLVTFLEPRRMHGQILLRKGENQWLYFPKLKRTLKVPRRQALAGSDFSYGDILNIDLTADYSAALTDESVFQGQPAYVLKLTATRPEATYDSISYEVRQSDHAPLRRAFFTKSGKKLKTLEFRDHDEALLPRLWIMKSALWKDSETHLIVESMDTVANVPDSAFSLQALRRQ
uniref:Outer membrane lipoprotein-sorting protein n=1 Tax=Candidatus Kentrum sp. MB TaxID=2138164 RepID=A0A450X8R5_9GAMM|nr:MAG: outer membrane lipoprotein-sorting protein [Candidatus Kentron sp. MB]VFK29628.1 MAG: outer membrane lipoprotein-sorting protein [Candidatus Kentron sp. MB]VFK74843.1 MAG: outer membrane lipoprotein-sorting protein [Candidatus Kentron sp. MB]